MGGSNANGAGPAVDTEVAQRGQYTVDEHLMSPAEVAERYGCHLDIANPTASHGLTAGEAAARLLQDGANCLSPPQTKPEWLKFLEQFANKLMILLMVAGVLVFIAYGLQPANEKDTNNLILGAALVVVVFITCTTTYFQEKAASNVMASLSKLMPNMCIVVRDGKDLKISAADLVKGDLVKLAIGDRVPADVRVVDTQELKVECSSITGESDFIPASVEKKHDNVLESRNVLFMSSLCMNGQGLAIVIRTSDETQIGKISSLAGSTTSHKTSLQVEIERLVKIVTIIAILTGITLLIIGLSRRVMPWIDVFINGFILVLVANCPEGLPATVTSCLAITAQRLQERNVLIKRIDIIENLGAATVIASDKTGTLTQNRMTVENLWVNKQFSTGSSLLPGPDPNRMLDRISRMAGGNLNRLSRLSRNSLNRASRSAALARASRMNVGGAANMALGRKSHFKGDGTIEALPETSSSSAVARHAVNTWDIQNFMNISEVAWDTASPFSKLLTMASVCNRARYDEADSAPKESGVAVPTLSSPDDRKVLGDATDTGLLRFSDRLAPHDVVRTLYKKLYDVAFNSVNKYAYCVVDCVGSSGKKHIAMLKGAPEIVLQRCTHYYQNGQELPITDEFKADMMAAYERFGFMGERVIGFTYRMIPSKDPSLYKNCVGTEHEPPTDGFVFLGLISLVDPPRPGVPEAVQKCRTAGICVYMVTGDHPLTAEAIARKVGIITLPTRREVAAELGVPESQVPLSDERVGAIVVTGSQIKELKTVAQWDEILDKPEIVFARTSPQQKLQIVENLQRRGEVVAVTGDGVNDSPALKKAQIGVAMGSANASDVAREAGDIVLLDDQFASIVVAIEEGRTIFDNLKKSVAYTLTHLPPELLPIFLNIALNFPLGLGSLMILTIDLLTEQGPAISLAYEKAEDALMDRPPRSLETDRLVTPALLIYSYAVAGLVEAVMAMIAFFSVFWWHDIPVKTLYDSIKYYFYQSPNEDSKLLVVDGRVFGFEEQRHILRQAMAAWYITVILCQVWNIFACKTRTVSIFKHGLLQNKITLFGLVCGVGVMIGVVYIPGLHNIMLSASPPAVVYLPHFGFLAIMWSWTEYVKHCVRNQPEGFVARTFGW